MSPTPTPEQYAYGMYIVDLVSASSMTFLTYDILLTFDDEVALVWSMPWISSKFLYFFVRYLPLMVQTSTWPVGTQYAAALHWTSYDCFVWQIYQSVASALITLAVDAILILRVFALFFNNKVIQRITIIAFVLEIVTMAVGLGLALPTFVTDSNCINTSISPIIVLYGGAPLVFQALLFVLTAYKFILGLREGWGEIKLVKLLMRDGTWAFFFLFFVMLTQGSGFLIKNHALSGVLFNWQLTVLSFCGYRILLNLQKLAKKSALTRTQDSWALSSLHYTSPNHTTSGTLTMSYELTSLNVSSSASRSKTTRPEADIEMVPRSATGAA